VESGLLKIFSSMHPPNDRYGDKKLFKPVLSLLRPVMFLSVRYSCLRAKNRHLFWNRLSGLLEINPFRLLTIYFPFPLDGKGNAD